MTKLGYPVQKPIKPVRDVTQSGEYEVEDGDEGEGDAQIEDELRDESEGEGDAQIEDELREGSPLDQQPVLLKDPWREGGNGNGANMVNAPAARAVVPGTAPLSLVAKGLLLRGMGFTGYYAGGRYAYNWSASSDQNWYEGQSDALVFDGGNEVEVGFDEPWPAGKARARDGGNVNASTKGGDSFFGDQGDLPLRKFNEANVKHSIFNAGASGERAECPMCLEPMLAQSPAVYCQGLPLPGYGAHVAKYCLECGEHYWKSAVTKPGTEECGTNCGKCPLLRVQVEEYDQPFTAAEYAEHFPREAEAAGGNNVVRRVYKLFESQQDGVGKVV